jgi:sec-independent protein translocase protein TatA
MFDIGGGEIILVLLAVLLLFGPKKIPEVAQMVGKGMREFRKAQDNLRQQIRDISTEVESTVSEVSAPLRETIHFEPLPPSTQSLPAPDESTLPMNFDEAANEPAQEPHIRPDPQAVARPRKTPPTE